MIAAAGSGRRLGAGGPKAFVEVGGRSLLAHALAAVASCTTIERVVIAAPPEALAGAADALAAHRGLEGEVIAGGDTRAASVRAALEAVGTDLVLIHDAARPLATADLFDAIVARLRAEPAADSVIAAAPIADTVKRGRRTRADAGVGGEVAETIPRDDLWAAQTPQGFRVERLRDAQARAEASGSLATATDEASLIESVGGTVLLEPSGGPNLKVTDEEDLRVVAALLAGSDRV